MQSNVQKMVMLASILLSCIPAEKPLPALPPHMANHTFCFVVGAHHSGTTLSDLLLAQHVNATALRSTL